LNPLWLIVFGVGTLLLRAGFALQASGSLRSRNATGSILRLTADMAAGALAFWAVGAGLLFGTSGKWLSFDSTLFMAERPEKVATEFFFVTISLIGGAVVSGALAERSKFYVGVISSAVLAGLVFPLLGHWVWFGWLQRLGVIDIGGATVIHLPAAVFAAVGVAVVGSRTGKYNRDGSSNSIPGHALPLLSAGTLLLLIGWFPYLLGCTLRNYSDTSMTAPGFTAMNVLLAGAGGVAGGLIFSHFRYRKPDLFFTCSGLLGALVAVTPCAVAISGKGAVLTGLVSGIIVPLSALQLDMRAHLDDPLGLIAIHGVGSIWGMLAAAIFIVLGPNSTVADHLHILMMQAISIAVVAVPTAVIAASVFLGLKSFGGIRVPESDETNGLDLSEHDLESYPDFQRTMMTEPIKDSRPL
jgi:Amt family ammonium transporter